MQKAINIRPQDSRNTVIEWNLDQLNEELAEGWEVVSLHTIPGNMVTVDEKHTSAKVNSIVAILEKRSKGFGNL